VNKPQIYLAGPTVFWPNAFEEGERLKEVCARFDCVGFFPLDTAIPENMKGLQAAHYLNGHLVRALRASHGVVADLSPWRGPHVDDGTAIEVGRAYAWRIPVWGYTTEPAPLVDRIGTRKDRDGVTFDHAGRVVEDLGQSMNAMVVSDLEYLGTSADECIERAARRLRV